jgi:hypothetical protein
MPQHSSTSSASGTPAEQTLARVAAGLRAARLHAGLDERRVVELLAARGLEVSIQTLLRWEGTGLIHVDAAVQLADVYGLPLDALAGRRSHAAGTASDGAPPARSAC